VVPVLQQAGHLVRQACRAGGGVAAVPSVHIDSIGPDTDWEEALEGMDAVVHLAARVHVMRDQISGAAEFHRVNTDGTLRLARAAAAAGARRFVFISTIKVNGETTTGGPFSADDEPHGSDPYAISKLAAEQGLRQVAGLEPVIIRPPLVYGPGAKGNLERLCRLAQLGVPVPFAGIDNRRDLIGVANLASLVECCIRHPRAAGQVFLAADGEALSTPELYQAIAEGLGRPARMFGVPVRLLRALARPVGLAGEVDRLTQSLEIDIRKTREVLGWRPQLPLRVGIAEMARASVAGAT
jgi:nucleoside-diphosphate-sugar epimerase